MAPAGRRPQGHLNCTARTRLHSVRTLGSTDQAEIRVSA